MTILGISTPWEALTHSYETGHPSRISVTIHGCTYRGYVSTIKALDGSVPFASLLEKDFIDWCKRDPRIIRIMAQPGPFTLDDGSSYTPDFLLRTCDGRFVLIEVKWEEDLKHPKTQSKLLKARAFFARHGIEFHVVTETFIRDPHLRDNIKMLAQVAHIEVPAPLLGTLYNTLRSKPKQTFAELAQRINSARYVKAAIARGQLRVDLMQPLNEQTPVYRGVES